MTIAYRVGELPDLRVETEPTKHLPDGARISVSAADALLLPYGCRFGEATTEQLQVWFHSLLTRAGLRTDCLVALLAGLELREQLHRWYVLSELMERSAVRDVLSGKPLPTVLHPLRSREEVKAILSAYDMRLNISTSRTTGKVTLYAVRYVPKKRIYVGTQAMLDVGQLSREEVEERLEKNGMSKLDQEEESAA